MDMYKTAACNELARLLAQLKQLESSLTTQKHDLDRVIRRINKMCDMLDLIERQEKHS